MMRSALRFATALLALAGPVLAAPASPGELRAPEGFLRAPELPDTLRVLAIRVEFQPDTLSTTTGDGSFLYEVPDSILADPDLDWVIDPPPHDSSYFADQLLALRNYYQRFSRGAVTITGLANSGPGSGGDILPRGQRAAYRLPYPMWHVNHNDGDEERLHRTLTELFVDAWRIADSTEGGIDVSGYDLFLVFHAGSGNEFDTGADLTPHDIPSAAILPEDLSTYTDLPGAIVMGGGGTISRGAILPEMQRQGDIEVGMYGSVCHHVGFLMGLPHLYDTETGDPGIGMLGLMDRGFGGFFGMIPTPPSAWTRAYMGWDSVRTVQAGGDTLRLGTLYLPDSVMAAKNLDRLVRIPITRDEYYLLEARHRDPEGDSTTVGYDRAGRRITFFEDYTWEAEEGFGVMVRVEDHDFDLPSGGILIWHIDDGVIRQKVALDQLQVNRDHRAVDLEEADGSQDIGYDYDFLAPGDGSEYGVLEDGWFDDNEIWREANSAATVEFGPSTVPSTVTNAGGMSHISITAFSGIADSMSCVASNAWRQGAFPDTLAWTGTEVLDALMADLDGDGTAELVVWGTDGVVRAWRGNGTRFGPEPYMDLSGQPGIVFADTSRSPAALFFARKNEIVMAEWDANAGAPATVTLPHAFSDPLDAAALPVAGGLHAPAALYADGDGAVLLSADAAFNQLASEPCFDDASRLVRIGPGGTLAVLGRNGSLGVKDGSAALADGVSAALPQGITLSEALSLDWDGDGAWDLVARDRLGHLVVWSAAGASSIPGRMTLDTPLAPGIVPADLDGDGLPELVGRTLASGGASGSPLPAPLPGGELLGIEPRGILSEGAPLRIPSSQLGGELTGGLSFNPAAPGAQTPAALVLDVDGIDRPEWLPVSAAGVGAVTLPSARPVRGYPVAPSGAMASVGTAVVAGQLDGDADLELAIVTSGLGGEVATLRVVNLPGRPSGNPRVWWGSAACGPDRGRTLTFNPGGAPVAGSVQLDAAYVWPNPVSDDAAHIRFRSGRDGRVNVRIYDLVGRRIFETDAPVVGGVENEVTLDASSWPSGVFVARVEAAGKTTLIRFAVVQ